MTYYNAEADEYHEFMNRQQQREGLAYQPWQIRKYVQAQRILCQWYPLESTPAAVAGKSPKELYGILAHIGFVWSKDYWRPDRRRSKPISYNPHVVYAARKAVDNG